MADADHLTQASRQTSGPGHGTQRGSRRYNPSMVVKQGVAAKLIGGAAMRRRQVRFAPLAAGFALLFLGACGRGDASKAQQAPPAVPVVTAKVTQKTVPEEVRGIGTVVPYATVAVKARVDGQITEVGFAEGQPVRRESLLFLLDH